MTEAIKKQNGLAALGHHAIEANKNDSKGIIIRAAMQSIPPETAAKSPLSDYIIEPIKDFTQSVKKGNPKTIFTLLVALTALKYIAAQNSLTTAALAVGQMATAGVFLGPQGIALLGVMATAGLALRCARAFLNNSGQSHCLENPSPAAYTETALQEDQNGAILVGATSGSYVGRRIQVEGEGRFEAGLQAMELSSNTEKAARIASVTLPVVAGAAATYGALRYAIDISPESALKVAGTLGAFELGRRSFNYCTQREDSAVQAVRIERAKAISQGSTSPVWEMTTGVILDTAGTSVEMASNGLLQSRLGALKALGIRLSTHALADRHSLQSRDQKPSALSTVFNGLSSRVLSFTA